MRISILCLPIASVLTTACGGGSGSGSGSPDDSPLLIYPALASHDGYFQSNNAHVPGDSNKIAVGANGADYVAGYVRILHGPDLPALSGNVTRVLLALHLTSSILGVQSEHPDIYVRHTDFGAVIDGTDYDNDGLPIADGTINWGSGDPSPFLLDVTAEVLSDLGSGYSDFYLLASGVNTDDSYWILEDVDDPADADAPHLVVELED